MRRPSINPVIRVSRRNATFQQWTALLANRTKRNRAGEMIVQGVRPITLAQRAGLTFRMLLWDGRPNPSPWATGILTSGIAPVAQVAPELLSELGERSDGPPELLALVAMPADDLSRIEVVENPLITVFDRPGNPGNIGSLARSADALGGHALLTTGHAADAWDPRSIRASTGSVFSIPVIRAGSHLPVLDWVAERKRNGCPITIIGTDEVGTVDLFEAPLGGPSVVVVGSESAGMSAGWREACDVVARIPMSGTASSLNAANAGSIVLYEALRQRIPWAASRT